jgi:hypothetical protein
VAGAAPSPQTVYLQGLDENKWFSGSMIGSLIEALSEESGDRGIKIVRAT